VPVNAKHKDLAKKFLAFYMSQDSQAKVLAAGVNLPVVNDLPAGTVAKNAKVTEMLTDARTNGIQLGWANTVPGAIGQGFVNPQIENMFLGQTTPDAIARSIDGALDALRAGN
jgi:raffinose/stachyose/melibiose transport system substrate-binding protein